MVLTVYAPGNPDCVKYIFVGYVRAFISRQWQSALRLTTFLEEDLHFSWQRPLMSCAPTPYVKPIKTHPLTLSPPCRSVAANRMTTSVSSLYSELPLMGSQVRILTVEPGGYGETARTKLRVGYLLHESGALLLGDTYPVQYQALSYRWGSEGEPTVEISRNYWSLFIGESAFQALAHLRHDWQPVNVWIDAICINQEDFTEKAVQVPRMRDIYANAEEVVVWLGQGDQQIRDLLDRLAHTPDTATARKAAEIDGLGDHLEDLCVCSASSPKTSEELVKSMQALLRFPWFSRVWCKQEIWAARKASLHYEDISCEWQNFDVGFFERMVASTTGDVQSVPGMTAARKGLARV